MADEEKSQDKFQVKDRRRFTEEGTRKEEKEEAHDTKDKSQSTTTSSHTDSASRQPAGDKNDKAEVRGSKRAEKVNMIRYSQSQLLLM